eukprot:TCONS_00029571-protein
MANIKICTFNTNGLREPAKRANLKQLIISENPDVVYLQETHKQSSDSWDGDWPGYKPTWTSGSTRSKGCGLLVRKKLFKTLKSFRDPEARFIILQVSLGVNTLNFCCVYAPDKPGCRPNFFEGLFSKLTTFCGSHPLIIGGDFNFVENPRVDRFGPVLARSQFTKGREEFDQITQHFNLCDRFTRNGKPEHDFTWSNKEGTVRSRLDRIYVTNIDDLQVRAVKSMRVGFSDHNPVFLSCKVLNENRGPGYWKMNTSILEEPGFQFHLSNVLAEEMYFQPDGDSLPLWWDDLKIRIRQKTLRYSIARIKRFRLREQQLQTTINDLLEIQKPDNASMKALSEASEELDHLRGEQGRGASARSGQLLAEVSELPNQYFFACEKARANQRQMKELIIDEELVDDPEEVRANVAVFYEDLFSEADTDPNEQKFFLEQIGNCFPADKTQAFEAPISQDEVLTVLRQVHRGKSPGRDGIPYEFYITFQEQLCQVLTKVFNSCLERGLLSLSQREAVISLIPKDGDLRLLKYWRPISLMCCDLKILAKILANRLKTAMPDLVRPQQVCGVPGRKIQHHTLLIRELIAHANHKERPLYVVSLDQEKAFDRVDWGFMFKVLLKLGLPKRFVEFVRVLYTDVTSAVNVNGTITDPFEVKQGVRQGCPLSMLLYSLVIEALCVAIDKCNEIYGYHIPNQPAPVKRTNYADDITIIVNTLRSIRFCLYLIQRYNRAAGSRLNVDKTRGIAVKHPADQLLTVPGLPIKWNRDDTKILGVIFHPDLKRSRMLNWKRLLKKIEDRVGTLGKRNISLLARARVVNSMVLSKVWHVSRVFPAIWGIARKIDGIVFKSYIWQDKREAVAREILHRSIPQGGINLLSVSAQGLALRLHDLLEMGKENQPLWCYLAGYWLIHDLRNLRPAWSDTYARSHVKHVAGPLPTWHAELLMKLKIVLPKLKDVKPLTVAKIRGALGDEQPPEVIARVRRTVQQDVSFEIDWKAWYSNSVRVATMPKHRDVQYLAGYNALGSAGNLAKWLRWEEGKGRCPRCNAPVETIPHIFLCYGMHSYQKSILALLRPVLPQGCTFERFTFGVLKHPMAKAWAISAKGNLWQARCKLFYEQIDTNPRTLFYNTARGVKKALSVCQKRLDYACPFYDHQINTFIF